MVRRDGFESDGYLVITALGGGRNLGHNSLEMTFKLEDGMAQAARLPDLTPDQTRLALAVGLFAEDRLTLAQAAALAGLDCEDFQQRLVARGIPLQSGRGSIDLGGADKPWKALRGSAFFVGDPFAPVVSEEEISVLQKADSSAGC